jgi:uncharacterized Zn-binding protein involved in type VI secretion
MSFSRGLVRVGDLCEGECNQHPPRAWVSTKGKVIEGSSDIIADGLAHARIGDRVKSDCGHYGTINSGSANVFSNGRAMARVNDTFDGNFRGVIVGSSGDTGTE